MMNEDGRFLLGLRASWKSAWPNHWDVIGGRVEAGETPEAAMVREVREETGVVPTSFRWLACFPERRPDLHGEGRHHIYLVTSWEGGEPRNICDEHSDLRWFLPLEVAIIPNLVDDSYRELTSRFDASARQSHHG
jgi:8-oxo-dGTP pyrophosphatase MutT (NUDIX family)